MEVSLTSLLEGIFMQRDWNKAYINSKTAEIIILTDKHLELAKTTELDQIPDNFDKSGYVLAKTVMNSDFFIRLPVIDDKEESVLMHKFLEEFLPDEEYSDLDKPKFDFLIKSKGLTNKWYSFHVIAIKNIAAEWANIHNIRLK